MNNFITLEVAEFLDEIWKRDVSLHQLNIPEQKGCNWNKIDLADGGVGIGWNLYDFFCIRGVDFIVPKTAHVCFQTKQYDMKHENCKKN